MKKIIITMLILLTVLSLVACNNKEKINNDDEFDGNVSEIIGEANLNSTSQVSGDATFEIGLHSTEDRAVYNFGNIYYLVYDFEGENVSGLSYYYTYEDEETAQKSYDYFKESLENGSLDNEEYEKVYIQEKYVILKTKEKMYKGTTKKEVIEAFEYLKQINSGDVSL